MEISPLAADLRADQEARTILLGEVSRVAVALEKREPLVKDGGGDFDRLLQFLHQPDRDLGRGGDEKDLLFLEAFEEINQPSDPIRIRSQRGEVGFAFRKTGKRGASVAEHHASGSKFIQKTRDDFGPRRLIAGEEFIVVFPNSSLKQGNTGYFFSSQQRIDGLGDRFVAVGFVQERFEIVVTLRIEKAQPGEVPFEAELLGGGGEQQQAGD